MDTDNLSYEKYLEVQKSLVDVLSKFPQEHSFKDLKRVSLSRKALHKYKTGQKATLLDEKSYFVKSLDSKNGLELTQSEFQRLHEVYGSSMSKLSLIDSGLLKWLKKSKEKDVLLSTGGACALESIDTKIIQYLSRNRNGEELVQEYVEKMFSRFPTWTQITGAIIPSAGVNVMYDETFPWFLRIKEYGIKDPEAVTQQVYENIFTAVSRFVRLHDPNSKVVKIPFSSLHLDTNGYFEIWYEETKKYLQDIEKTYNLEHITYNPEAFYKYWLEYTYFGPEILNLNKTLIKKLYPDIYEEFRLDEATIHVRGKQLDHLDVERVNSWMHKVILGSGKKTKRLMTLLSHPFQRLGVALYMWRRDNYEKYDSIGFAGMMDFNYCGRVVHEDGAYNKADLRALTTGNQLQANLLDSPLRLHAGNLDQVITFLERFRSPNAVSFSKEVLINLTQTRTKVDQYSTKIEAILSFIEAFIFGEEFLKALLDKKTELPVDYSEAKFKELVSNLYIRTKADKEVVEYVKNYHDNVRGDIVIHRLLYSIVFDNEKNMLDLSNIEENNEFLQLLKDKIHHRKTQDMKRYETLMEEKQMLRKKLKKMFSQVTKGISEHQSDSLTDHVNILPLGANIFVSYMQQFLFIPSIRNAYLHLVQIEQNNLISNHEKEGQVIEVIHKVLPVISKCLTYILGGGDYPWKERFEFQYEAV